jgi:hypothetical protein
MQFLLLLFRNFQLKKTPLLPLVVFRAEDLSRILLELAPSWKVQHNLLLAHLPRDLIAVARVPSWIAGSRTLR